jgi:hypothetical protein
VYGGKRSGDETNVRRLMTAFPVGSRVIRMFGLRLRVSCLVGLLGMVCGRAQNCVGVMSEPASSIGSIIVASCWSIVGVSGGMHDVSSSSDVISVRNLLASSMS